MTEAQKILALEKKVTALDKEQKELDSRLHDLERAMLQSMEAAVAFYRYKGWSKTAIRKLLGL